MNGTRRAAAAEAYGTFLLTMLGPGTITAMKLLDPFGPSPASLGFIGLAHGVGLLVAVYSIGHVSGAHINPAVTIAQWATRRLDRGKVAPYIIAQLLGATIASIAQLVLWSSPGSTRVAQSTHLGDTIPGSGFGLLPALLAEVVATAILLFTISGVTDKKAEKSWAGVTLGLVLAAMIWVFGPISGASLNPARTFGPTLVSALAFGDPAGTLWIYVAGPILGGLLGAFLYDVIKSE